MSSNSVSFWLNDELQLVAPGIRPTTTLLRYIRDHLRLRGTKEACGEGDCGACTVVLLEQEDGCSPAFRAVNSCLLLLPMVHGKRVYTVEGLRLAGSQMDDPRGGLHPVQRAVVEHRASQCGFCTPGVVMSMFEACYRDDVQSWGDDAIQEQMAGNLCRCTGYRSIGEAARQVGGLCPDDRFARVLREHRPREQALYLNDGEQVYIQPATFDELWEALDANPEARLVAGGTDLALRLIKGHEDIPHVISLAALSQLRFVEKTSSTLRIGSGTSMTRLHESLGAEIPALGRMLRVFGSRQVRNRATVGGNLCTASPIGDLAPVFMALDASVVLLSNSGERTLSLGDFFLGYRRTALGPGEILHAVELPRPSPTALCSSYKVSKRKDLDISTVSAGMYLELGASGLVQRCRLALGGVAPVPLRARTAEAAIMGRAWDEASLARAMDAMEHDIAPISDIRGSASYRMDLARNLLRAFFFESRGERIRPGADGQPIRNLP